MHVPKFKVGDVVLNKANKKQRKVIYIIHGRETFKGNWFGGAGTIDLENSYVFEREDKFLSHTGFDSEDLYDLIYLSNKNKSLCPRCGCELVKKHSEYTQTTIEKCSNKNCGWC